MGPKDPYEAMSGVARTRRGPLLCPLAAAVLGLCACSGPPPPLPSPARLLAALDCPGPAAAATPRLAVDFYLDASGSMRGFVAPGSSYLRLLEDLLGRLESAGYGTRPQPLCDDACLDRGAPAGAVADPRRIYSPSFYRGQQTPLAQLLLRFAAKPQQGLTLLLSDLEQSTMGTDQRTLVAAFRRLAERTRALLLYSFHASFGPDAKRRGAPPRRYYLLVIAPTAPALAEIERLVLRHLPAAQRFQPAEVPMTVREVRLGPKGPTPWGVFRQAEARPCGADRTWFASFVEQRPIRDGEPLPLQLLGDFGAKLATPADLQYEVRRLALGPMKIESPAWRPMAAPVPKEPDALSLSVPAPRPERGSWDLYRIRVRSGSGNLAVPTWAEEGSGTSAQGKTPQLAHLVRALQQAITEEVVILDLLLALGRGV